MSEDLGSQITNQSIFQNHFSRITGTSSSSSSSSSTGSTTTTKEELTNLFKNKLICKNNSELYFAVDNLVRCCTINPTTKNYKLLKTQSAAFEIQELVINESETFLALVSASSCIDIIALPSKLNTNFDSEQNAGSNSVFIDASTYRVEVPGTVKQAIWQPIVANDSMLVVLNDRSEVFGFDIFKSTKVPQVYVKSDGNKDVINSIAFGSKCKISDGLKVYASTNDKILAMNFFTTDTQIAVSKEAVDQAIADSKTVIELIKENFGSDENLSNLQLLRLAYEQHAIYENMQYQLLRNYKEMRGVYTSNPYELFKVNLNLSLREEVKINYDPTIVANQGANQIISFGDNDLVSLFALINKDVISYYISLLDSTFINYNEPADAKYVKPKKGFGFVDTFEKVNAEVEFCKNELNVLEFLQSEKLPVNGEVQEESAPSSKSSTSSTSTTSSSSSSLQKITNTDDKFVAIINSDMVIADCSSWVKKFVNGLQNNASDILRDVKPAYSLLSLGNDDIQGFAFVDKFSQEVAVVVRGDQLELVNFTQDEEPQKQQNLVANLQSGQTHAQKTPSLFQESPFAELESSLKSFESLVNSTTLQLKSKSMQDFGSKPSMEKLQAISEQSYETTKLFSGATAYAINLQARVLSQVKNLQRQLGCLNSLEEVKSHEDYKEQNERIERIQRRQETIDARMQALQDKIEKQFSQKIDLPLSVQEGKYFKEINELNATTQELIEKIADYKQQVAKVEKEKKGIKGSATNSEGEEEPEGEPEPEAEAEHKDFPSSETIYLENKLRKLRTWLKMQSTNIQDMMERLEIAA